MSTFFYVDNKLYINDDCFYIMLVKTDAKENNNKFYELFLDDNNNYCARYGRVGYDGKTIRLSGRNEFISKAKSKFSSGYKPLDIKNVSNSQEKVDMNKKSLLNCAISELVGEEKDFDKNEFNVLSSLIKILVEQNKHHITKFSSGKIEVDDSGLVKTALGVVSLENIQNAKIYLNKLKLTVSNNDSQEYINLLNNYLTLIPQQVPSKRGWHKNFFTLFTSFEKQFEFIDCLETSVEFYESTVKNNIKDKVEDIKGLFSRKIRLVNDENVIKRIKKYYDSTRDKRHSSDSFELVRVYEIIDDSEQFNILSNKIGNVNEYWHGTQLYNILSILKNGLIIPDVKSFNVTARMFGNGIYFANRSTKSLNYSSGYWGGDKSKKCFMFLADVAMGNPYKAYFPSAFEHRHNNMYPVKGYDSVIAAGNKKNVTHSGTVSNLLNDEFIVFDVNQVKLKYLCEFSK